MSEPSTRMIPASMVSRPLRQLSSVVLPQPDGPMMAIISARLTERLMPAQRPHLNAAGVVGLDRRPSRRRSGRLPARCLPRGPSPEKLSSIVSLLGRCSAERTNPTYKIIW